MTVLIDYMGTVLLRERERETKREERECETKKETMRE